MMMNECADSFRWPADMCQFTSRQPPTCGLLLGLLLYLVMLEGAQLCLTIDAAEQLFQPHPAVAAAALYVWL